MQIGVPKQEAGEELDPIRTGVVTFFNHDKGFGFIKDMQTQESVFVHINQLSGPVKENEKVTYEVEMGPKGPNAVNVKKGA
jgi:cold shock CspA family protein